MLLFQKDDNEAFNELVKRYKDRLVNYLYRFTGSFEDAEDVAQDVFIRIFRMKHTYMEMGRFKPWFYTIAGNQVKSHLHSRSKKHAYSLSKTFGEDEREIEVADNQRIADEQITADEEVEYVQKAINKLELKHKEIIILRDIEDMEYEEIAEVLKIPVGTVKSRINRARESLKVILERLHEPKRRSYK